MRKKRVKLFVDGEVLVHAHFSGIGHYTADLLRAVDKLLLDDTYSHFSVEIGVPFKLKHKLARFEFENFAVRGVPLPVRAINGLKNTGRLPPIDLLFGNKVYLFPNYSSWPTLFGKSIPIIYDLSFVNHGEFVEPRNREFLVSQVQLAVNRAKRIITISKSSKQEIVEHYGYPEDLVKIAYPAVDMHKFYRRSQDEVHYVKAKYGVFGDYILFVGNIEPRKNLITLLKAYRNLKPEYQKKYGLLLIGAKGWLDSEINREIVDMRMNGLRVMQPVDYVVDADLPALYTGAKAFAYVSRYEGFGIPPIESMACGTPAIASDNSSLPEAVGDAAIKVNALDDAQLTKSLEGLLSDETQAAELQAAGYEQVMNFDWMESARILLTTVEEANQ
jgi:glycosyltransferase involved in cell wall biosynthesis